MDQWEGSGAMGASAWEKEFFGVIFYR